MREVPVVEPPVGKVPQSCVRAGSVKREGAGGPGREGLMEERTVVGLRCGLAGHIAMMTGEGF